jgi:hypothetical protein
MNWVASLRTDFIRIALVRCEAGAPGSEASLANVRARSKKIDSGVAPAKTPVGTLVGRINYGENDIVAVARQ